MKASGAFTALAVRAEANALADEIRHGLAAGFLTAEDAREMIAMSESLLSDASDLGDES